MSLRPLISWGIFFLTLSLVSCNGGTPPPNTDSKGKNVEIFPLHLTTEYTDDRVTELFRLSSAQNYIPSTFRIKGPATFGFETPVLRSDGTLEVKIYKPNDGSLDGQSFQGEIQTTTGDTLHFTSIPSAARSLVIQADSVRCDAKAATTVIRFNHGEFPEASPYAQLIEGKIYRSSTVAGFEERSFLWNSSMSYNQDDVHVIGPFTRGKTYETKAEFKVWKATTVPDRAPALIYNFKVRMNCY